MYAKITNETTKECSVGVGTDIEYYKAIGMTEMEVEQAYDGAWYIKGYAPEKPAPTHDEQSKNRESAYKEEIDGLHARKQRKEILCEWTEEDETEYIAKVKELSAEIAERYPYNEEVA